jgi:uncharacterized protein YbjT (DUF2867 family)
MRVLLFGASGMVGQGVLRECLLDSGVSEVTYVGRSPLPVDGVQAALPESAKLRQIVHADLFDLSSVADQLTGFDACFFCLGVSSFRMKEAEYRRITQVLTVSVAKILLPLNPAMVFVYVSGSGTDAKSKTMWARVKGETENDLLSTGFRAAYMFRPGLILTRHGIRSKTPVYNVLYTALKPLLYLLALSPRLATNTEAVGRAMLRVVRELPAEHYLEGTAINRLAAG